MQMQMIDQRENSIMTISNPDNNEFFINVYNYFLDDFPKTYSLSNSDTIENLKEMISLDANIKTTDIKHFKDIQGQMVKPNMQLRSMFESNYNLNMEIFFNYGLKISTSNKKMMYFMCTDFDDRQFLPLLNIILTLRESEKGGKIIIGVDESGFIRGISIPDQDYYKNAFLKALIIKSGQKDKILKDIDYSFFRVKGNKSVFNHGENKKLMIIKIKGKNLQIEPTLGQYYNNSIIEQYQQNHQQNRINYQMPQINYLNNNNYLNHSFCPVYSQPKQQITQQQIPNLQQSQTHPEKPKTSTQVAVIRKENYFNPLHDYISEGIQQALQILKG